MFFENSIKLPRKLFVNLIFFTENSYKICTLWNEATVWLPHVYFLPLRLLFLLFVADIETFNDYHWYQWDNIVAKCTKIKIYFPSISQILFIMMSPAKYLMISVSETCPPSSYNIPNITKITFLSVYLTESFSKCNIIFIKIKLQQI